MALDFPASPATDQIFTSGAASWRWDGTKWQAQGGTDAAPTVLAPTTGQTVAIGTGKTVLNPAGALAALTLTLPASGSLRVSTRQRIAALSISGTVDWATGELPANGMLDLTYVTSLSTWVRV